jgi:undecaprenyl-diphosphatase
LSVLEAIVLGIVQGITEFLPVSSSGHLVLAQKLMSISVEGVELEVAVHLATLLAIVFYYRSRLVALFTGLVRGGQERRKAVWYAVFLVVGSIPAGAVGILLKDRIEDAFESPLFAAAMLCVTGAILLSTRLVPGRGKLDLSPVSAILVGCAQALAILPGISRSGSTVSTGLWAGVEGRKAAEFSFLLAVPAIAGAGLVTFLGGEDLHFHLKTLAPAFAASLVSGYLSLILLVRIIEKGKLFWFGPYCLVVGGAFLVFLGLF